MRDKLENFKNSKIVWFGLSTLIIVALIYFSDVNQFLEAFTNVNRLDMTYAFISGMSVFLVWGYVWHNFFTKLDIETTVYKSYKMFMAGSFMNSITPLGQIGGEPFMAYIVSKNTGASYEKSLSGVMSADLVNAIPVVTYTALGITYLLIFRGLDGFLEQAIYFGLGITIFTSILIYLLWFDRSKMLSLMLKPLKFFERHFDIEKEYFDKIEDKIRSFKESFDKIGSDPKNLTKVVAVSHLYFITQFVCLYFILKGLEITPSFIGIYFTVILAGLAMFAPTPGGTGAFESFFTGLLVFFYPSVSAGTAVAAAVLFRFTTYWPGILVGYLSILSLRKTKK